MPRTHIYGISLIVCLLFWQKGLTQDAPRQSQREYNVVYIQLDEEGMSYKGVSQTLDYLITNDEGALKNKPFSLLYANNNPVYVVNSGDLKWLPEVKHGIEYTGGRVQISDVKDALMKLFKEDEPCVLAGNGGNRHIEVKKQFEKINFHCFVGSQFFDTASQYPPYEEVLGKFLIASGMQDNRNVNIYYYNMPYRDEDKLTPQKVKFKGFYSSIRANVKIK